ncbi:MAG: hypothetical protein IJH64_08675 [Oscillospiraceae bacterium]|nr:hypothetical protein [Oscillospiraceae bacterium]
MKRKLSLIMSVILTMSLLMLVGCGSESGGGGGSKEPEPFTLGEYTYKLDQVRKTADGYEASLLIEGDSAPIIITNGVARSGVDMMLASGDKTYSYSQAGFSVLADDEKVGEFGAKAVFSFVIPSDLDAPDKAVVTDSSSGDSTEIDITGITIEE